MLLLVKQKKNKQGGSVMCVRSKNSDYAHPQFSNKCLLNEEQIETHFSKTRV